MGDGRPRAARPITPAAIYQFSMTHPEPTTSAVAERLEPGKWIGIVGTGGVGSEWRPGEWMGWVRKGYDERDDG
jgi:hypothetical protein